MTTLLPIIGWVGNLALIIGLYGIGNKWRKAFFFSIVGETLWIIKASYLGLFDFTFICVIFLALAIRSYIKWGKI